MTRSALSTAAAGTTLVGIRFRPEAAATVFRAAAHLLANRQIHLNELWNRRMVDDVSDRVCEQRTTAKRVAVVQQFIASRLETIGPPDPAIQHAVSLLIAGRNGRVEELARRLGMSERHLRRRFATAVGYGPKVFHRIVRFQNLLALANASTPAQLDELSLYAGYADQAHMTREVGEFAGVTPSGLLGRVESALSLLDASERSASVLK